MAIYRQAYAKRIAKFGMRPKTLHLFDSFQGLPRPDDAVDLDSPYVQSGVWQEGTYKALTEEELTALCASVYDADKVLTYGGWFADTLPRLRPGTRFAMLHLDCDLYKSSIEVLDHVFSGKRIADGCVVFRRLEYQSLLAAPRPAQGLAGNGRKARREVFRLRRLRRPRPQVRGPCCVMQRSRFSPSGRTD
jgi:hypothetical protein